MGVITCIVCTMRVEALRDQTFQFINSVLLASKTEDTDLDLVALLRLCLTTAEAEIKAMKQAAKKEAEQLAADAKAKAEEQRQTEKARAAAEEAERRRKLKEEEEAKKAAERERKAAMAEKTAEMRARAEAERQAKKNAELAAAEARQAERQAAEKAATAAAAARIAQEHERARLAAEEEERQRQADRQAAEKAATAAAAARIAQEHKEEERRKAVKAEEEERRKAAKAEKEEEEARKAAAKALAKAEEAARKAEEEERRRNAKTAEEERRAAKAAAKAAVKMAAMEAATNVEEGDALLKLLSEEEARANVREKRQAEEQAEADHGAGVARLPARLGQEEIPSPSTMLHADSSRASAISSQRLERSQERRSTVSLKSRFTHTQKQDEEIKYVSPRGGAGLLSQLVKTGSKVAEERDKGASSKSSATRSGKVDGPIVGKAHLPPPPPWLPQWRKAGKAPIKQLEVPTENGLNGDCLALADASGGSGAGAEPVLVCIGCDGDGKHIGVRSVATGNELLSLRGHDDLVCCVAVNGDVIASGGRDRTIRLWSRTSTDGVATAILQGCESPIYGLALEGNHLVSGEGNSKSGTARLWSVIDALANDMEDYTQCSAVYAEHGGTVWSVALATRLGFALSASLDASVKVWPLADAGDGSQQASVMSLAHPTHVFSVSVNGELAATGCGDGRARLWSLSSFDCLRTFGVVGDLFRGADSPVFTVHAAHSHPLASARWPHSL